ncbi:MAG: amylo-alpha-1,6-glucosidase [Streptosporangiales bacterium]|nr:amylo-alpha-1,6-glucosidase [Streptosporangiales bacterium]
MLHDLTTCLRAPTAVLSAADGQVRATGAQGVFHADVRALAQATLTVDGAEPVPLTATYEGPGEVLFVAVAQSGLRVHRRRLATADGVVEEIELPSRAAEVRTVAVRVAVASDLAEMHVVRRAVPTAPVPPELADGALVWSGPDGLRVSLTGPDARLEVDGTGAALTWAVQLPARGTATVGWRLVVTDPGRVVGPAGDRPWPLPRVVADDRRLPALVERSLADLDTLRLATARRPDAQFLAAGAPWYFTLFGRDSLWAARMLLPLGTDLAAGTLHTLADLQGTRHDQSTGEAPGKIPHELRRGTSTVDDADGIVLPPVYYGTVDATCLWILLLHDAWRWGFADATVRELLPALEAAVGWLLDHADPDGDGFLEYVDESGRGLANQGWKDSADAVRFRDGRLAEGPIALCEVQGYAHEAALAAAALLDAFDRQGAQRLTTYAAELAAAFRRQFWVADAAGSYPALALDRTKRPVDAVTSNIGHLLGTGLLTGAEARLVAQRLRGADMRSGYGLRTISAADGGYDPLSYHCGSVWPHDTAIVALGLMREGLHADAVALAAALLESAPTFAYRLPELYAGDGRAEVSRPVPYPTACFPQAWAAASAVSAVQVLLGLAPDVPSGELTTLTGGAPPVGALRVDGLRVDGQPLTVALDREGDPVEVAVASTRLRHRRRDAILAD